MAFVPFFFYIRVYFLDVSMLIDALVSLPVSSVTHPLSSCFHLSRAVFLSYPLCGSSGSGGLVPFTYYLLFGCSHFPVLSSHPHLFINSSLLSHSHLLLWVELFPSPELPTSPQFSQYAMFFSTFQFLSPSCIFNFSCLSISLF